MTTTAVGGVIFLGANSVNASTKIDNSHVQVVSGDTLSKIASDNHTTVDQLVKDNHIANQNLIHVGDKLIIVPSDDDQANNNNQTNVSQSQDTQSSQQSSNTVATTTANTASDNLSDSEAAAKAWIAQHESGGSYTATNGQYFGKYQLSSSYLNGDYSPANQDRVANQYVNNRYGSWVAAKAHWMSYGWY